MRAFVKRFYKNVYGVTCYNINIVNDKPTVEKSGHTVSLKKVTTPKAGDMMQTKTYSHVAIVKSVTGNTVTLIEQNWSYISGEYRYAKINRTISTSDAYFYRLVIDGAEQTAPTTMTQTNIMKKTNYSLINTTVKNAVAGNTIVIATYNGNKLSDIHSEIYNGTDISFEVYNKFDKAKVMVLENLHSIKPLCKNEEIYN